MCVLLVIVLSKLVGNWYFGRDTCLKLISLINNINQQSIGSAVNPDSSEKRTIAVEGSEQNQGSHSDWQCGKAFSSSGKSHKILGKHWEFQTEVIFSDI